MDMRLGSFGSKAMDLPFSFFLSWVPSADVMLELVWRTYSRAAVRWGWGRGTWGHRASWMDAGCGASVSREGLIWGE